MYVLDFHITKPRRFLLCIVAFASLFCLFLSNHINKGLRVGMQPGRMMRSNALGPGGISPAS